MDIEGDVFEARKQYCSAHSGKGTGLLCTQCVADLANERDSLLVRLNQIRLVWGERIADKSGGTIRHLPSAKRADKWWSRLNAAIWATNKDAGQ
jgi:hypothetical protein